jgi:hypothetical protein
MNKLLAVAIATTTLAAAALPALADDRVQVGRLSCDIDGGVGYIILSEKTLTCEFSRKGHKTEVYEGNIKKLGIDIGVTEVSHLEWLVFAATDDVPSGALRGTYIGGSGEASLGVGGGANWLFGGFEDSISLQPWSVQATKGVNFTWAFAGLELY